MAAVTLLGSATFDTTNGSKTVTATPAVGDLIVIVTAHTGNTAATAPTDNNSSGTYVQVNSSALKATSADALQIWVRTTLITAASSTTFTHAPGTTSGGGLAVHKITGMTRAGLSAIRQSAIQSNQTTGTTPTPVLGVAALTGNPLIGAVFNATSPATMTARSSPAYSETADVGYSTPTTGLETMSINSGETGTSIAWGGTSGSAFSSIVAELDATVPLDDGADGWWSGAQRSFAGVAIAGAAAALSVSVGIAGGFIHQDELPAAATTVPGAAAGAPPTQRAKVAPVFQRWGANDELPTGATLVPGAAAGAPPTQRAKVAPVFQRWAVSEDLPPITAIQVDEQGWQPPILTARWSVPDPWVADEAVPAAAAVLLEEQDWAPPIIPARFSLRDPWTDGDAVPAVAPSLPVDDLYWTPSITVLPAPSLLVWAVDDIWPTPPATGPGAAGAPPTQRVKSQTRFQRWTVQDDLPTPVAGAVPGAAAGAPPTQRAKAQTRFQRWPSQDEFPTPAAPIIDDSDPAPRTPLGADSATWILWATSEEIVPQPVPLPIDELYWQKSVVWPPAPIQQATTADDQIVPQPSFLPVDDYWPQLYSVRVAPVVRLWHQQDEIERLAVDEVYGPPTSWISVAPVVRIWHQQDERNTPPIPLPVDEMYWQKPVVWPPPPIQPARIADDEIVPQPVFSPREEYWLELFSITVKPLVHLWHQQDQVGRPTTHTTVYTHDSRERVGGNVERVAPERIGGETERVTPERLGETTARVKRFGIGPRRQ